MNRFSCLSTALLVCAVACGSDSAAEPGGEIRSQEDVQSFFQAVAPELIELFNQLADQQANGAATLATKQTSSVPCPDAGSLDVDTEVGQATLSNCSTRGIVINATLFLMVSPIVPGSFSASFSGTMAVSGTFTGTIEVLSALIQWTDPATDENTYWEVTALANAQTFTVTSAGGGGGGGETVTPRVGGSCVPGQQGDFSCTTTCLDICLPQEVAQTAFCAEDSVCECRCVNYNL